MLDQIVAGAPVFLLIAVRCFAMIMTMPLFSIRTIPSMAKVALAGYLAYFIFPQVSLTGTGPYAAYAAYIAKDGSFDLTYILIMAGEALIGILMGFYMTIIFAAFSTAGQFIGFQLGFSANEVYDAMSQVENPLMGQYLNLVAMLIFLQNKWALMIFTNGLKTSFSALNAFSLVTQNGSLIKFLVHGLTTLFADALVISLPIIGTLLLINITTGILSKAAPQMNLLSEGFPIIMLAGFFLLTALMPQLCDFFTSSFYSGFKSLEQLFVTLHGGAL